MIEIPQDCEVINEKKTKVYKSIIVLQNLLSISISIQMYIMII